MQLESWEREVTTCYAQVLRALIASCGRRDRAEDALHDALVDAMRDDLALTRIERADAWLYAVASRKLRRALWRERLTTLLGVHDLSYPEPSLARIEVTELLKRLSARQRELVVARFYLGLSFKEIAHAFGISIGTATTSVSHALQRLRADETRAREATWKTAK